MNYYKDKTIWITGASSGIGKALAEKLSNSGARCALTSRNESSLSELCQELVSKGGCCQPFAADVTNFEELKSVAEKIKNEFGPIDILVANAGNHVFTKPDNFNSQEYLSLMDLNYGGMLRCIEACLPQMRERGGGHIVGMASLAGFRGLPRAAAYGASKSAMIHFLESLRFHLSREKIAVSIVNPGFVRTPLTDKNDFRMPFLTEPEKAASIISAGIAKQKDEISFPIPFNWSLKLMRVIPFPIYKYIVERFVWKD